MGSITLKKWQSLFLKSAMGVAAVTALVFAFQNCGKAGFENVDLSTSSSSTAAIDPKLSGLPFPYNVSVNQLAFMSCQFTGNAPNVESPYFSWKVGAFDNPSDSLTGILNIRASGLKIRSEFQSAFDVVGAGYNASFRPTKYKEALATLPSVADTQLQLSFRKQSTPQTSVMPMPVVLAAGGGDSPTSLFLSPMNDDGLTSTFTNSPSLTFNYFQQIATMKDRALEARLLIPWGGYDASSGVDYYGALMSAYNSNPLVIGFAKSGTTSLSGPGDATYAYGTGLRPTIQNQFMTFAVGAPDAAAGNVANFIALTNVNSEMDMSTRTTTGASWQCSDSGGQLMAFKIVRNADRYSTIYKKNNFSLVGGYCPGAAITGEYCPSPDNLSFGQPLTNFPSGTPGVSVCPANRRTATAVAPSYQMRGTYCEEKYTQACPPEPFFPVDRTKTQPQYWEDHLAGNAERLAIYTALRRFLPESEWDINVARRCIVNKNSDNTCYHASTPPVYDEYFFPTTTVAGRDIASPPLRNSGCGTNGQECAAFMTMCIRR